MQLLLLDFPEEILLNVLSFLGVRDLLAFSATNRYVKKFYENTIRLQYIAELDAAGCVDFSLDAPRNPGEAIELNASIRERFDYLRKREARWRKLDLLTSAVSVPLLHKADISVYDLSGGVFAYGESSRETELNFVDLREISRRSTHVEIPSMLTGEEAEGAQLYGLPRTDVPWESYPFEGKLADFGLSLQDHDLVALITFHREEDDTGPVNLAGSQTIKLHLNEFSTHRPHPLAKDPLIVLAERPATYDRPAPMIEISGEHIAILLNFPRATPDTIDEDLFIYNWKTGRLLQHQTYKWSKYSCLTFVTPSLVVLLNTKENSLELIEISPASDHTQDLWRVRTLRLPDLIMGLKVTASCRGDPNPIGTSSDCIKSNLDNLESASQYVPGRRWGASGYGISADPLRAIISFTLVIIREHTGLPAGPTVNFIVHRDSLARLALEVRERSKYSDEPATEALLDTKWEDWGPEVTRWRIEEDTVEWVTTTAGQRQVFSSISADANWTSVIVIRDYNPYEVWRAKALSSGVHVDSRDGVKASDAEEEDEHFFEFDDNTDLIENGLEIIQTPQVFNFLFHAQIDDAGEPGGGVNADNEDNPNNVHAVDLVTEFHQLQPLGDAEIDNVSELSDDHEVAIDLCEAKLTSNPPLKLISVRVRDTTTEFGARYYKRGSIGGRLPCVEYTVAGVDELYSGLLLDEERIIGYLEEAEVFHSKMLQMTVFSMN